MKTIINSVETGQNIKNHMMDKGMSIADLSVVMGVTPMAIYKWTKGFSLPTVDNLVILSAIFEVTIDDLLVTEEAKWDWT